MHIADFLWYYTSYIYGIKVAGLNIATKKLLAQNNVGMFHKHHEILKFVTTKYIQQKALIWSVGYENVNMLTAFVNDGVIFIQDQT